MDDGTFCSALENLVVLSLDSGVEEREPLNRGESLCLRKSQLTTRLDRHIKRQRKLIGTTDIANSLLEKIRKTFSALNSEPGKPGLPF